jgi:hypothetical protein
VFYCGWFPNNADTYSLYKALSEMRQVPLCIVQRLRKNLVDIEAHKIDVVEVSKKFQLGEGCRIRNVSLNSH